MGSLAKPGLLMSVVRELFVTSDLESSRSPYLFDEEGHLLLLALLLFFQEPPDGMAVLSLEGLDSLHFFQSRQLFELLLG